MTWLAPDDLGPLLDHRHPASEAQVRHRLVQECRAPAPAVEEDPRRLRPLQGQDQPRNPPTGAEVERPRRGRRPLRGDFGERRGETPGVGDLRLNRART